jgi:hypothetical protein
MCRGVETDKTPGFTTLVKACQEIVTARCGVRHAEGRVWKYTRSLVGNKHKGLWHAGLA